MRQSYNPIETYLQEAEELLAQTEQCALALSENGSNTETVHELFRLFHTIKGSGAMCGLDRVAQFTHHVETALEQVRSGAVPVMSDLSRLILAASDHIRALLAAETGGAAAPESAGATLIASFAVLSGQAYAEFAAPQPKEAGAANGATPEWEIEFHPDPGLFACGHNPALLFRDLRRLGECEVTAHIDQVPTLDQIQPDACRLWWTMRLRGQVSREAIQDVFVFVEDGSRIEIKPACPAPPAETQQPEAPARGAEPASKSLARESTVRVPASRLDRLVNLVGELVMTQSRLAAAARRAGPEFANPVQELQRLVSELRDDVLEIRMLPIGTIFGRFRRVVHDVSAELGKDIELILSGAETELDKSILDQIGDPVIHLLRNSIDHGLEPLEERARRHKACHGTIRLSAEHIGSAVVISIEDDGRGIDREAVRRKAIERQLIAPDAVLTDQEIFNLILLPGFSTAQSVTNLSGRGVGMDVVKREMDKLRGSVVITSEEGRGTKVALTLPLTLAIIEGLLIGVGPDQVIVPMSAVVENVELRRAERERHNGRNVVAVRGELTPYIDLRELFETPGEAPAVARVVIVRHEEQRVGLVVDRVVGTHQTVIQSLGRMFRRTTVVSGATIMGDGRVALILDVPSVVRHAHDAAVRERERAA